MTIPVSQLEIEERPSIQIVIAEMQIHDTINLWPWGNSPFNPRPHGYIVRGVYLVRDRRLHNFRVLRRCLYRASW